MPETDYLKVPADRVGVLIGTKGETKKKIENATQTQLDMKILLVFGKQIISLKLLHVDSILILHLN